MPAQRTRDATSTSSATDGNTPSKGWSKDQKSQLFHHVLKHGETGWSTAIAGKTGHQCQEQWKKTLLPFIRRQCGF